LANGPTPATKMTQDTPDYGPSNQFNDYIYPITTT